MQEFSFEQEGVWGLGFQGLGMERLGLRVEGVGSDGLLSGVQGLGV